MNSKALFAALTTTFLWAFAFPASKAALVWFSVEQVVLLRYLIASGFFILLFLAGYFSLPRIRDLPGIFILGVVGVTVYHLLFVRGVGAVAAGAAAMILAAIPVFSSMLARIFLGEKLPRRAVIGICLSLIGVTTITIGRGLGGEFIGYIMLILAAIAISVLFVFQKPYFTKYSPLAMTAYTSIAGTMPLLIYLQPTFSAAIYAPIHAWIILAALGIFSSGVGFFLWYYALSKLHAGVVTSFLFLQPVNVSLLAWVWLGEIPDTDAIIGGAIILFGVGLTLSPPLFPSKKSVDKSVTAGN